MTETKSLHELPPSSSNLDLHETEIPHAMGPYTLVGRIASGGMGQVFEARDEELKRHVAVKLIRPERLESPRAIERFQREAQIVARLDHPNIVRLHHVFRWRGQQAIVMEFVQGITLSQEVRRGPLPISTAVNYGLQVASGLEAAHRQGFVHRDLKAGNIIVTPQGRIKILDFGLAKDVDLAADEPSDSQKDALLGTPHSMAPEQVAGEEVDHRTDLFALGVLLYELTTGLSPFRGETLRETLTNVLTVQPPRAQDVQPAVPAALSDLIDALLAKDPRSRPQDLHPVIEKLAAIDAGLSESRPSGLDRGETETGSASQESTLQDPGLSSSPGFDDLTTRPTVDDWPSLGESEPNPLPRELIFGSLTFLSLLIGTALIGTLTSPATGTPDGCRQEKITRQVNGVTLRWARLCPGDDENEFSDSLSPFFVLEAPANPQQIAALMPDSALPPKETKRGLQVSFAEATRFCTAIEAQLPTDDQLRFARRADAGLTFETEEWRLSSRAQESLGASAQRTFRCVRSQLTRP